MRKKETKYEAKELAEYPEIFQTSPDMIKAAFLSSVVKKATVEEAKQLVKTFKNKEVK